VLTIQLVAPVNSPLCGDVDDCLEGLAPATSPCHWLPCVTLGTRGFSSLTSGEIGQKADATSGLPREKTSGPERFDLLFSLNFDLFYPITFKPITAYVSCCVHMQWHVKI